MNIVGNKGGNVSDNGWGQSFLGDYESNMFDKVLSSFEKQIGQTVNMTLLAREDYKSKVSLQYAECVKYKETITIQEKHHQQHLELG